MSQISKETKTEKSFLPEINLKVDSLPSKSLAYPENCSIKYRPYVFGEVKMLNQTKLPIKEIFEKVLDGIDTSFDKKDLTVQDFLYLGFLRKISSLGTTKFKVEYTCPVCKHKGSYLCSSDQLEFNDIKAPELPMTVTLTSGEYTFQPFTVKNFFFLIDRKQEKDEIAMLACQCIKSSNGGDFEQMYKVFFNITADDAETLEAIDKYFNHRLKPIEVQCSGKKDNKVCNQKIKIELDGGQALLIPFREHKKPLEDRIRFGS